MDAADEGERHMKQAMKSILVLAVIAMCAVAVQAQSSTLLKADVPFSFSIGDRHLSSGSYTIRSVADKVLCVQDANGEQTTMLQTIPKQSAKYMEPKLIFHRYGNEFVLAEIWADSGREVPPTARVKELAKIEKGETLAVLLKPAK
jgi:hypothetical protein